MNITSVACKRYEGDSVDKYYQATIDGIPMVVPMSADNRHYQAIQEWIAEGNTPTPAEL